jgi:hypothetical protein
MGPVTDVQLTKSGVGVEKGLRSCFGVFEGQ